MRHGLSEDRSRLLHGFLEADETFIGGRGDPISPGRSRRGQHGNAGIAGKEPVLTLDGVAMFAAPVLWRWHLFNSSDDQALVGIGGAGADGLRLADMSSCGAASSFIRAGYLFRQSQPHDWASLIDRAVEELERLMPAAQTTEIGYGERSVQIPYRDHTATYRNG